MKTFRRTLLLTSILFLAFGGCAGKATPPMVTGIPPILTNPSPQPNSATLKGVSLSPRSYQSADFTGFFALAQQVGEVVSWAGDWGELESNQGGPVILSELAATYHYTPLVELQFFQQSSGKLLRPLDDATGRKYLESAVTFASKYQPSYLGLGIEVNVLYEKSPSDFEAFVRLYDQVYDAVKAASPGTTVFTVFQFEKMNGLNGGLFGGDNSGKPEWPLLERFPKSDILAFTTYPGLVYKSPSEIPADYYLRIRQYSSRPVAFTEIGWHSEASPAGWESSDSEQAEFIRTFRNLSRELKPQLTLWSFLYDQDVIEPFRSMGLYRRDGTAKSSWSEWISTRK